MDKLLKGQPTTGDVSPRAAAIGRLVDRLCRTPGDYVITISVPVHGRSPWTVQFSRLEPMRRLEIGRRSPG